MDREIKLFLASDVNLFSASCQSCDTTFLSTLSSSFSLFTQFKVVPKEQRVIQLPLQLQHLCCPFITHASFKFPRRSPQTYLNPFLYNSISLPPFLCGCLSSSQIYSISVLQLRFFSFPSFSSFLTHCSHFSCPSFHYIFISISAFFNQEYGSNIYQREFKHLLI